MTEAPSILTRLRRVLGRVPGVLRLRRGAYARAFASHENVNLYRGVFDTFEQAALSAPNTKPPGYDNEASARMVEQHRRLVLPLSRRVGAFIHGRYECPGLSLCRSMGDAAMNSITEEYDQVFAFLGFVRPFHCFDCCPSLVTLLCRRNKS